MKNALFILLLVVITACKSSQEYTMTDDDYLSYVLVQTTEDRLIDIVIRDLVTIQSHPTELKLIKDIPNEKGFWELSYSTRAIEKEMVLEYLQKHPNVSAIKAL